MSVISNFLCLFLKRIQYIEIDQSINFFMKLASLYNPYLFHKSIDTNMQKENMDSIKEKKDQKLGLLYDERKIILG